MKAIKISLLGIAFLGLSLSAKAQVTVVDSGYCGANLTWALTSDSILTIRGNG